MSEKKFLSYIVSISFLVYRINGINCCIQIEYPNPAAFDPRSIDCFCSILIHNNKYYLVTIPATHFSESINVLLRNSFSIDNRSHRSK
jgi:hypothetical protein